MPAAPDPRTPSRASSFSGSWAPGQVLAERYRIVALLGEGGMGEVYLADDLTLGEPVALKFLAERLVEDEGALERFRSEVRLARDVTHPNVARVHDIGTAEGRPFLSMEFVDGEDLASLLRRIGRLPTEKAVEIARQVCSGLAAAHERGVLHRDLKPGNVMLDGEGRVRVTDFGLAALAGEDADTGVGTPSYMAPEQLEGAPATVRTEVYSLGLLLYELFTGKRVFEARSVDELRRLHADSRLDTPSTHTKDIDPVAERAILQCLEKDPSLRPPSVRSVAQALPGGDPLEAARVAGETPAPWLVAESGARGGISVRTGVLTLVGLAVALGAALWFSERGLRIHRAGLTKPPAVLEYEIRELLDSLGSDTEVVDHASSFTADFTDSVQLGPDDGPIAFWYRDSPDWLVPRRRGWVGGDTLLVDPPHTLPGMRRVLVTPDGRLRDLEIVPPERRSATSSGREPDWASLVRAAGLDPAAGREVEPGVTPPAAFDHQRAWEFAPDGEGGEVLRVEGAAFEGRPVWFRALPASALEDVDPPRSRNAAGDLVFGSLGVLALLGGAFVARSNLRRDRAHREGAFRLAVYSFVLMLAIWVFRANHVPTADETQLFTARLRTSLFAAAQLWVFYLALEPAFRRLWPHQITSWIRVLDGHFEDPLVGRDLLAGLVGGVGMAALMFGLESHLGTRDAASVGSVAWNLGHDGIDALLHSLRQTPLQMLTLLVVIAFTAHVTRRRWAGLLVFSALILVVFGLDVGSFAVSAIPAVVMPFLLVRFGVLAFVLAPTMASLLGGLPLGLDPSRWYARSTVPALLLVAALAAWGYRAAVVREPEPPTAR